MKNFLSVFILIITVLQACSQTENESADVLLTSLYTGDKPGAAVAVIKSGELIFRKAYGVADMSKKTPVTTSANFNICSLTKQFTAYSVLKLESEKKLSLDDKIGRYFPDFNSRVAGAITIRHLLAHSSGIVDHYGYVDKKQFSEFSDRDVLNAISSVDSLYFNPGSGYRYSNTAYCLLSLIIEKVTGMSYPEYIRQNIFTPLKMSESGVISPDFKIPERVFGYEPKDDGFRISDAKESLFFSTMGDGGIYTSVDDYLKWIMAILSGSIPDPGIIKVAQSAQNVIDRTRELSYGFGWFVAGHGLDKTVFHTGSNGDFRTIIFMIPSQKYAVIIFSNRTGIDLEDLVHKINKIYKVNDKYYVKLDSLIS